MIQPFNEGSQNNNDKGIRMIKIKFLVGLVAGLAMVAISAAPAGAWFKSLNGTPQGKAQLISTTSLTIGTAAKVSCESAEGEWHIQTKGQWWIHGQEGKQEPTTEGPHLYLKVSKWNTCKATVQGISVSGAVVSPCEFQIEQPQKNVKTGFTATIVTGCVIKVPLKPTACEIVVTSGSKKQTEPINEGLKEVKGENGTWEGTSSVLGTAEVTNINGTATCLTGGTFTNGGFKSASGGLVGAALELV